MNSIQKTFMIMQCVSLELSAENRPVNQKDAVSNPRVDMHICQAGSVECSTSTGHRWKTSEP